MKNQTYEVCVIKMFEEKQCEE